MGLVVFVEHRSLGVLAHASRAHLVNAKARRARLVYRCDDHAAGCFDHRLAVLDDLLGHRPLIVADRTVDMDGNPPLILLGGKGDAVLGVGQHLAEPRNKGHPRAELTGALL